MKIIKAELKNIQEVTILFDQYRQFYKLASDLSGASAYIEERLTKKDSVIFLAFTENEEAAGFVQLYPSFSSLAMKPLWILNDLFVSPLYRKANVARELMAASEQLAISSGAKGLTLMTAIDNIPAQKLYTSLGWNKETEFFSFDRTF
jgi:ribosomal protein S18 acetylase RimI-like enzyme